MIKAKIVPYYRLVKLIFPDTPVYLVEDNVALHRKSWDIIPEEDIQGIERPPFWAPMSSDLNMIKPCWGYLKDMFVERDWFYSASAEAQDEAKRII